MKKGMAIMMCGLLMLSGSIYAQAGEKEEKKGEAMKKKQWSLVWSDEFSGTEIDRSKWNFDLGNWIVDADGKGIASGWGNNEKEFYTDSKENAYTKDGKLIIKAKKEQTSDQFGTYDYTSAKVKTKGHFSHKYGRYEIKAKLPAGKGLWPAIWMLPEEDKYGSWAASGEIDIMESWGSKPNLVAGTIHYGEGWPNNKYTGKEYHFKDNSTVTDWHTYALEWEPGELRWYVDGELYQTQNKWYSKGKDNAANFAYPAPFDQNFYLIMNLAVGGWFDGDPDASTTFPQQMEIDYVRVFDLKNGNYADPVEPKLEPVRLPANAKQPLADGNFIYDSAYEQPITDIAAGEVALNKEYWNFVHLPDFGGAGAVSVEQVSGMNFAKTSISNPGSQLYSLQLIQNLSLGQGGKYRVSFDAKSTAPRSLMVKAGAGPDRGWVKYSNEESFNLSDQLQSYEFTFDMLNETDIEARLEFNLGGNGTNPVWIGNVRVEDVTGEAQDENASKQPLPDGNYIYNGTFDQGRMDRMIFWNVKTDDAKAEASVNESSRELKVDIKKSGKSSESVQVLQKGVQLIKGNEYKAIFKARATKPRDIQLDVLSKDGTVSYSEPKIVQLSSKMEEKTVEFTMTDELSDLEGQLIFNMGGAKGDVFLDDIVLLKTTDKIDYGNIDLFPLKNGDFSNGLTSWGSYIHYDAAAMIAADSGKAEIAITNEGNEPWSLILQQENMKLAKGAVYEVSFEARSTKPREAELTVENVQYTRFLSEKLPLADEMQTYSFEFTMPSDDIAAMKFLLGKTLGSPLGAHAIEIDNVVLKVKQ
ncbi:carbohydrate binding domain-containing protein [Metabacillus idriensis]|nr:carbohydrate binding domain-containing protein [Metabacillus idriensis]MCM3598267.1 carbohydrate binding domain-containing protein [Metabacillus idriensis]